jgi:hypothetical protein
LLGVPRIVRSDNSQSDPFTGKSELTPTDIVAGITPQSSMLLSSVSQRGSYVNLITTVDDKIHFLRNMAQDIATGMSLDPTQIFIRYRRRCPKWSKHVYEYTTALPWHRATIKRKFDESRSGADGHTRWLYMGEVWRGEGLIEGTTTE